MSLYFIGNEKNKNIRRKSKFNIYTSYFLWVEEVSVEEKVVVVTRGGKQIGLTKDLDSMDSVKYLYLELKHKEALKFLCKVWSFWLGEDTKEA